MEAKFISGSGKHRAKTGSHPEVWLAVQGFLVAFLWEMLQMAFYVMDGMTAWAVTKSCALASLGDAGIMVGAAWIADRLTGGGLWRERLTSRPVGIFLGVGLAATAAIEPVTPGYEVSNSCSGILIFSFCDFRLEWPQVTNSLFASHDLAALEASIAEFFL